MMKRKIHFVSEEDSVIHKMFWDSFFVMLASELSVILSTLIDGLMVSNFLSSEMFVAQSLVRPFLSLVSVVSGLMAVGTQIIVSKRVVKGQFADADSAFTLSMCVGLILSIGMTAVCFLFGDALAAVFGASKEDIKLFEATKTYLLGLGLGSIPLTLNAILQPILQINGDKSRVKRIMLLQMVINCAMNALSIFVFDLGLFGIGLATSVAYWVGFAIYLLHFTKRKLMCRFRFAGMRFDVLKDMLVLGFPKATVRVCNTLRALMINRLILFLAAGTAMSAVGIDTNIRELFRVPGTAVALSAMLITEFFYGEQDKAALNKLIRISMSTMC